MKRIISLLLAITLTYSALAQHTFVLDESNAVSTLNALTEGEYSVTIKGNLIKIFTGKRLAKKGVEFYKMDLSQCTGVDTLDLTSIDNCYIYELILPDCVKFFSSDTQQYFRFVEIVSVTENCKYYKMQDDFLLSKDGKVMYGYNFHDRRLSIPEGVEIIRPEVYEKYGVSLSSIYLPKSVKDIGSENFHFLSIQDSIFIQVHKDNKNYSSKNGCLLSADDKKLIFCANNHTLIIPEGVTTLSTYSIYGKPYAIVLPKTLTTIEDGAAYEVLDALITIPKSVTSMDALWFRNKNCRPAPDNKNYVIENGFAFNADKTVLVASLEIKDNFTIPETVTTIGKGAFCNNDSLKSIVIPDNVVRIDKYAFGQCDNLTKVILPKNLEYLGDQAFFHCNVSQKHHWYVDENDIVVLPSKLKWIGQKCFDNRWGYGGLIINSDSLNPIDKWYFTLNESDWSNRQNGIPLTSYLDEYSKNMDSFISDFVIKTIEIQTDKSYDENERLRMFVDKDKEVLYINETIFDKHIRPYSNNMRRNFKSSIVDFYDSEGTQRQLIYYYLTPYFYRAD